MSVLIWVSKSTTKWSQFTKQIKRFAEDVIRPLGIELDKMHDPRCYRQGSPLWRGLDQYREIGLVGQDQAYGPRPQPAQRALLHCMVLEDMCRRCRQTSPTPCSTAPP